MKESFDNSENDSNFVKNETEEMGKKLPPVNEEKLKNNPFSQDLIIKVTKRIDPIAKITDEEGLASPAWSYVDKAKSTKMYKSAVFRNKTSELTATGKSMFLYIMYEVEQSKDWILITPDQYKEKWNSSKSSYLRGIEELVTEGYIATTLQKYVFWTNPILFFSGNRVGKYPDRVKVENNHCW